MTEEVAAYQAALAYERDRSADVSLAEYKVLIEAKVAMDLHGKDDPRFARLCEVLAEREAAVTALNQAMMRVVQASKAAREFVPVCVEVDYDLH